MLLADALAPAADILVVGAGGGVELSELAKTGQNWRLHGVDPSAEMLGVARRRIDAGGVGDRITLQQGYVADAPEITYDSATSLLTLHFVPDDGSKLAFLTEVRRRLKSGAPFVLVDGCADMHGADWERLKRLYLNYARSNGAEPELIDKALGMPPNVHFVRPGREEQLLEDAGFCAAKKFYQGLWFHGWLARAC